MSSMWELPFWFWCPSFQMHPIERFPSVQIQEIVSVHPFLIKFNILETFKNAFLMLIFFYIFKSLV